MTFSLPDLEFQLPDWKAKDFKALELATQKIQEMASRAGTGSARFVLARKRLYEAALTGGTPNLIRQMSESIDARALAELLCTEAEFVENVEVAQELLDRMSSLRSPMSRLALTQLIRAFFIHFDGLSKDQGLKAWCEFLKSKLKPYMSVGGASELRVYAKNADLLFQKDAPRYVVQRARDANIDFDTQIQRLGLTGFSGGRYLTLCRYQYYLQTLVDIDVGENHSVLKEICREDVVNAPYADDKLLGHAVLEVLIDRAAASQISEAWRSTILTIAGDPRVPKTHTNYQKWWVMLGEKRIALMRGWLSRLDLKIFLKILEQSARDSSNSDMERMFVSRKRFMEGLLSQGHVTESRLFLSDQAIVYLKRHYKKGELPGYAKLASPNTSMIYLNLGNDVFMIEGSHSFKLKLMNRLPAAVNVANYSVSKFSDSDFRTRFGTLYAREFSDRRGLVELTHDVHLNWQHNAIEYLQTHGLDIEVGKMIERTRLREYKQKFGAS